MGMARDHDEVVAASDRATRRLTPMAQETVTTPVPTSFSLF